MHLHTAPLKNEKNGTKSFPYEIVSSIPAPTQSPEMLLLCSLLCTHINHTHDIIPALIQAQTLTPQPQKHCTHTCTSSHIFFI